MEIKKLLKFAVFSIIFNSVMAPKYLTTTEPVPVIDQALGNLSYTKTHVYFDSEEGCHILTLYGDNWPDENLFNINSFDKDLLGPDFADKNLRGIKLVGISLYCFPTTGMRQNVRFNIEKACYNIKRRISLNPYTINDLIDSLTQERIEIRRYKMCVLVETS